MHAVGAVKGRLGSYLSTASYAPGIAFILFLDSDHWGTKTIITLTICIDRPDAQQDPVLQEAINGLPEDRRPEVICSASAVGMLRQLYLCVEGMRDIRRLPE